MVVVVRRLRSRSDLDPVEWTNLDPVVQALGGPVHVGGPVEWAAAARRAAGGGGSIGINISFTSDLTVTLARWVWVRFGRR